MYKDSILLNNVLYNYQDVLVKLNGSMPNWERDIFIFLKEWFSTNEVIDITTSGSTGKPKIITREKKHLIESAKMTGEFFSFSPKKTALLCLPAKYIAGKMMLVRAIEWNLSLDYIEPKLQLDIPDKEYYFSAMTPQQIEASIHQISNIKSIIIGGAPISPSLEKELITLPNNLFATYGMTETVSHIALRKLTPTQNNIYITLPNVSLSTNVNSCLIINAPNLLDIPITTTDIVELKSPTSFIWIGRNDFIINSGGVKIFPEKLESIISHLINSPYFLFGKPDDKWGQKVILIIEGTPFNTSNLETALQADLSAIELPKEIIFTSKFSRTKNGKLNRAATFNSII